jgi:hypothetical protein
MTSYSEDAARLRAASMDRLSGKDRKIKLMVEHPETYPDIREPRPYMIEVPSFLGRTGQFERLRATTN